MTQKQINKCKEIKIPIKILLDESLTPNEKLLYGAIKELEIPGIGCLTTNAEFADIFKILKRSMVKLVNHLKEANYIEVQYSTNPDNSIQRTIFCNPA